jgi:monolysocardiolipin acyltransferase
MFVDGFSRVMNEERRFPRFLPRVGQRLVVAFGDKVDGEEVFGDLRRRWKGLVKARDIKAGRDAKLLSVEEVGQLSGPDNDMLRFGDEATEIRLEVVRRVRDQVLKVRRSLGYPEPDPTFALAETWAKDSDETRHKSKVDGSWTAQN